MSSYIRRLEGSSVPEEEQAAVETTDAANPVTKPSHYQGYTGIECKEAMQSMLGTDPYIAYMQGCAFKYLWRWKEKNGVEDLKKARECIGNMLDALGCDRS